MGIIDRSVRSATARAVGRVRVEEMDRDGFISSVQDEPDVALKIIGNLSERLRQTNEMVTSPASQRVLADAAEAVNLDIDRRTHCKAPDEKTVWNFV